MTNLTDRLEAYDICSKCYDAIFDTLGIKSSPALRLYSDNMIEEAVSNKEICNSTLCNRCAAIQILKDVTKNLQDSATTFDYTIIKKSLKKVMKLIKDE
jgi:ribosomal protein L40E